MRRLRELRNPRPLVLAQRGGYGRGRAHAQLKASWLVENSSICRICTYIWCRSRRVGGQGRDPRPIRAVDRRLRGCRGIRIEERFGFIPVNKKDSGRWKKGTYMGPAWTMDQECTVK